MFFKEERIYQSQPLTKGRITHALWRKKPTDLVAEQNGPTI